MLKFLTIRLKTSVTYYKSPYVKEKKIIANFNQGFEFEIITMHLEMTLNSTFLATMTLEFAKSPSSPPYLASQVHSWQSLPDLVQKDEKLPPFIFSLM